MASEESTVEKMAEVLMTGQVRRLLEQSLYDSAELLGSFLINSSSGAPGLQATSLELYGESFRL